MMHWYGLNRTYCDCLAEMRKLVKHNVSNRQGLDVVMSLIEELQVHGNRMEAALADGKDLVTLRDKIKEAKQEFKDLKAEIEKLEKKKSKKK